MSWQMNRMLGGWVGGWVGGWMKPTFRVSSVALRLKCPRPPALFLMVSGVASTEISTFSPIGENGWVGGWVDERKAMRRCEKRWRRRRREDLIHPPTHPPTHPPLLTNVDGAIPSNDVGVLHYPLPEDLGPGGG